MNSHPKISKAVIAAAVLVALFAVNFIIHLGFSPAFNPLTTDSGVFAYCGARMLAGDVLYRDCWDNKPPAVYLIDAGIVALGGQNPWAIWWFQLLWTTASSAVVFAVIRRVWRNWLAAALGALLFIGTALTHFYYTGGNLTENYLLLPLGLTAGALYASLTSGRLRWTAGMGLLTALAVLLKPTYFGMGAAAILTVVVFHFAQRKWTPGLKHLGVFMLGLILPLALVALVFWRLGALSDLWFAVLQHNVGYVEAGLSRATLLASLRQFFVIQPLAGLFWTALASLGIYGLVRALSKPAHSLSAPENLPAWWLGGLVLALPLQMASISISGKNFGHYYLEIMPALALLASAGPAVLLAPDGLKFPRSAHLHNGLRIGLALALAALLAVWSKGLNAKELVNLPRLTSTAQNFDLWNYPFNDLERYIQEHSRPDESVLIWATHPDFNFVTGRRSPTRYIFPLHVLTPTPTGESGFPELLSELAADPPRLIIQQVVSSANLPAFTAPENELCGGCSPAARSGMEELKAYIDAHYTYATQIYDWLVFVRK
ncbi:4-amino-4-deoxy-L-arabinose transferase [Longilinea arvoryzae]|uniref:4-amino-4-deoxy-L-arabinose transferase n=1 Tax=Longilinea arvoryzae TaxID=360412 RepID=A0A0S7BDM3_9CHLR|nr:glycosyltransferase family 39 protein [Longilinea arvoryzae]GAP12944.1 4-amino-4-deoxy-L-arabinose transferase [Longilinea arvoryzae]